MQAVSINISVFLYLCAIGCDQLSLTHPNWTGASETYNTEEPEIFQPIGLQSCRDDAALGLALVRRARRPLYPRLASRSTSDLLDGPPRSQRRFGGPPRRRVCCRPNAYPLSPRGLLDTTLVTWASELAALRSYKAIKDATTIFKAIQYGWRAVESKRAK